MKHLIFYLQFIFIILLTSCSDDKSSILSRKVQKDPGELKILNESSFMGTTIAGTSFEHEIRIRSNGGLSLKNLNVSISTSDPITFKDGMYPGTGGTCGTVLESADTCTIVILYSPINTNSHAATLNFTYDDALGNYGFSYTITADSFPILTFDLGTLYDFGNKFVNSSTDLKIKISNKGRVPAESLSLNNLGSPFSYKGGTYPGVGGTCGTRVTPGSNCEIIVNYSPNNNGEHLQDIILSYQNTGRSETNTLNLIAWGFYQAVLSLSDSSGYNFGTIASSVDGDKTFTVTHASGDVSATNLNITNLNSPFKFKGGSYPGTGGTCPTNRTLSKDLGSCTIVLSMNSTTSGTWGNTFTFSYLNGSETISTTRSLSGITKLRPALSFSTTGINDFGLVNVSSNGTKTFTVTYDSGELPATAITFSTLTSPFNYTGGTYPGTGGTCGSSLTSGSCTIKVSYSPISYGPHTINTAITYNDTITTQSSSSVTLKGITEGKLNYVASGANFGNVVVGQTKDQAITISSNAGSPNTSITVQSISGPYSFKGGAYPGTGTSSCGTTINASTNCYLYVTFAPTASNAQNGSIVLNYNDGSGPKSLTITLTGTGTPAATLSMPNTDFGTTSVNSVVEKIITISNSSTIQPTSLTLTNMPSGFSFKNGTFPGTGGSCGGTWSTSCTLVMVFNPTTAASYSGNLSFSYNDGTNTTKSVSATLTGVGVNTSDLFISRFDTVSFGSIYVGQTSDVSFTLFHGGSSTSTPITSKTFSTGSEFSIINDTCPASLSNGANCTFSVRFTPTTSGTKTPNLVVNYTEGTVGSTSRKLTGSATIPSTLTISPSSFDFGLKPTDSYYEQTFTVTHSGQVAASSISRSILGTGFSLSTNNCSTSLNSGASCTMVVRFTPSSAISYSGQFKVNYTNGYQTNTTTVNLTGTGTPTAALSFSPSSYDFGKIIQTQSSTKTITVVHSGPIAATSMSLNTLSAPYSFKGGTFPGTGGTCSDSLSSGSCTMVIDFAPTNTGVKNQTVSLSYYNGNVTRTTTASLTGESLAQAIISISETNPYTFGTTNLSGSIDKAFTLSNSGSVSGTSLAGSFDMTQFSFKGGSFPGTGGNCTSTLTSGSNCSIVLTFKPTQAVTYTGTFTLTYNDGLRAQTEFKTLKGTGSATLNSQNYLSLLNEGIYFSGYLTSEIFLGDVNRNESDDYLELKPKNIILKDTDKKLPIFSIPSLMTSPLAEGLETILLNEDRNRDGYKEILLSIHRKEDQYYKLSGYIIRCGRTGETLEAFYK